MKCISLPSYRSHNARLERVCCNSMTFNDWHIPLYALVEAEPQLSFFTYIYFNMSTIIGGFFIFNLFVAVIFDQVLRSMEYIKVMERADAKAKERRTIKRLHARVKDCVDAMFGHLKADGPLNSKAFVDYWVDYWMATPPTTGGFPDRDELAQKAAQAFGVIDRENTGLVTRREVIEGLMDHGRARDLLQIENVLEAQQESRIAAAIEAAGGSGRRRSLSAGRSSIRAPSTSLHISSSADSSCEIVSNAKGSASEKPTPPTAEPSDCCGFERSLRPLGYVTALVICVNIAAMCSPYRGMSPEFESVLELIGTVCTVYFTVEALLKICIYGSGNLCEGWYQYWHVRDDSLWNRMDFSVLAIEYFVDMLQILASQLLSSDGITSVRILRTFRAMRVLRAFKLSHVWTPLHNTLQTMSKAIAPVASLAVLTLIFTMLFALLGKELFGGSGLAEVSRLHFDDGVPAMITAMIVFSGEWAEFLHDASSSAVLSDTTTTIFVVGALLVGHFVVVNLFVAVLVEAFVNSEAARRQNYKALQTKTPMADDHSKQADDADDVFALHGITCGCCGVESRSRYVCRSILIHGAWNAFVITLVLGSCIELVYNDPRLDTSSEQYRNLELVNNALTACFALEATLKIFVVGFVCGRGAYLHSAWNCLDFFILLASLAAFLPGIGDTSTVRLLRVLRPLRLVQRSKQPCNSPSRAH